MAQLGDKISFERQKYNAAFNDKNKDKQAGITDVKKIC